MLEVVMFVGLTKEGGADGAGKTKKYFYSMYITTLTINHSLVSKVIPATLRLTALPVSLIAFTRMKYLLSSSSSLIT